MNEPNRDQPHWKYQPMMIVTDNGRLECDRCHALAICILMEKRTEPPEYALTFWCQLCWEKATMEQGVQ